MISSLRTACWMMLLARSIRELRKTHPTQTSSPVPYRLLKNPPKKIIQKRMILLRGWALQGDSGVGHSRETLGLGTPGTLCGWALQGDTGVGTPEKVLE